MIQVNLLPDVKMQYIKARRLKRLIVLLAFIITSTTLTLFVLLFVSVNIWQKARVKSLTSDINRQTSQLKATPDLERILTVQQQLKSLTALHQQKPAASRLFNYMSQIIPAQATLSNITLDFQTYSISISGQTDNIISINKIVDTLKFTNFRLTNDSQELKPAFKAVVLGSYGLGGATSKTSSFSINFIADSALFDSKYKDVALVIPNIITTRSEIDKPQDLFKAADPGVITKPTSKGKASL